MADVGNILNGDDFFGDIVDTPKEGIEQHNSDFFGDIVDTPKEGIEQHKKRECLKSIIDRGRAHLLGSKWTQEKVDKASDEIINKTYTEHKQCELNEKGEKNCKDVG